MVRGLCRVARGGERVLAPEVAALDKGVGEKVAACEDNGEWKGGEGCGKGLGDGISGA